MQSIQAEMSGRASVAPAPRTVGNVEVLPFTVRVVRTQTQLERACELRSAAYGHHIDALAEPFSHPEPIDFMPGTLVLLAEDKETGSAVGSVRFQLNFDGPLQIEESVPVPQAVARMFLAEITRLSVRPGYMPGLVRNTLWKAIHRYCLASQVEGMIVTSRRSLVRQYRMLGFEDVFDDGREFACAHVGGLPHRVMLFDVQGAERKWKASGHPLYHFMIETFHPDIQIFNSVSSSWSTPRQSRELDTAPVDLVSAAVARVAPDPGLRLQ